MGKEQNKVYAIKTENLTQVYSDGTAFEKTAIADINIEIEKGEFVGVIGHTGSGKSTLVQHLNGLVQPTSGKVFVNGEDIWQNPKQIRKYRFEVGLVFQYPEYQLFEETVYKDIAFGPQNMGLDKHEVFDRVNEAATAVGLAPEVLKQSPFELSGGQKRRVAIAGVLAMRPQILVLDEPMAGLDPGGRDVIMDQLYAYHKKTGATVLLVSHSMEDVAKYASKVLVLNNTQVYMYDTPDNVFKKADELEAMGLSVPQITKFCNELAGRGYNIPRNIYTVEKAKEALLNLLKKGGKAGA